MRRRLASLLVAATGLVLTGALPAAEEPCTANGEAPIVRRDRARAKARAVEVALARCAEAVAKRLMEDGRAGSGLSPQDRARAVMSLSAALTHEPGRLFTDFRVLSDRAQGGWVRVEVSGRATLDPLLRLTRAASLDLSRGRAIVGVLMYEIEQAGNRRDIHGEPLFGGQLARMLHDRGYEVRSVRFDPGTELTILDDPRALGARAREARVEVMIAAEVVLTDDSTQVLGRARPVSIDAMFQVVDASSGKLRGRIPVNAKASGSTPTRALRQALEAGMLAKVFDSVEPLLAMDGARATLEPRVIALTYTGIKKFRLGARTVIEVLKLIPGVSQVDERDFHEGKLEVEIQWAGTQEDLEVELTTEMSRHTALAAFRVVARGADRITFARE